MSKKIYILFTLGLCSCISFYQPDLDESDKNKIVVDARFNNVEGYQIVRISKTTTLTKPDIEPYLGCKVSLTLNDSKTVALEEYGNGIYRIWMDSEDLLQGTNYKLAIKTPNDLLIASDSQTMPDPSGLDTVYFVLKNLLSENPLIVKQGIQFYVNLKLSETRAKYFWWDIEETWEHHAVYPITWHVVGNTLVNSFPPDYSEFYCWTTKKVADIFILDASDNVETIYKGFPLHLVDNQTQRLTFCYSLLINQYTINESTFEYLEKLKKNSTEQGGLYSTQPLKVIGNLRCETNPKIEILGLFSVASHAQKRIFVRNIEGLKVMEPTCAPPDIPGTVFYYFFEDDNGKLHGIIEPCVICSWTHGTTERPTFWPKDL